MSELDFEPFSCALCAGPLVPLGALGTRLWYRCRDCGIDQSHYVTPRGQIVEGEIYIPPPSVPYDPDIDDGGLEILRED
ncbi:MAG TPA: hypothetical protein VIV12_30090 [Streptosporangiaceae bacterium]